ncbi:hypothetical protein LG302_14605 [Halomonas organivorans]
MFDLDRFVEGCCQAVTEGEARQATRERLTLALEDPRAVLAALGEPDQAGVRTLYRSDELTILDVVWGPRMVLLPHDHRMWAVIGIYTGREDNILWQRVADAPAGRIEARGATSIGAGEILPLGHDAIHSVINPLDRMTGALHVYGGDFFAQVRSEWEPERLEERPYDLERNLRRFEESNRRLAAGP